jgi:hypothetical protein
MVSALRQALDQLAEAVTTMSRLRDADGVHACSRLIWNAGDFMGRLLLQGGACRAAEHCP